MKNCLYLVVALGLLLGVRMASADASVFEAQQQKAVDANPPGISLTLRLPEGQTQFHRGEVIPLTAMFASHLPDVYQLNTDPGNRNLQWGSDNFQVDSPTRATDPLRVYYDREFGTVYSGPGPRFQPLGQQPISIPFTLNEWLRFDAPGRYRVYLTSSRVIDRDKRDRRFTDFQGRATASNAVELVILPNDPAWSAQTLQEALPLFNADGFDFRTHAVRQAAVRAIRFLGTPDAARAMVARYGHFADDLFWDSPAYYQTRLGLFGFPRPALVLQEMERRIADADFPVFSYFMEDLAQTQFLAAFPQPIGPYIVDDPVREKERRAMLLGRRDSFAALVERDRKDLAASVLAKQGRARAVSGFTLLRIGYAHPETAEHRELARALVPIFDDLTPQEQGNLLEDGYWQQIRGPDMLPILRRVYYEPIPGTDPASALGYEARNRCSLALRRLMELLPDEGRALLIREIASDHPRLNLDTLCSLPDRTLPALDNILVSHLAKLEDWDVQSRLVERYASKAILPRVKAVYGDKGGEWACATQSNLLAYFLRTDPGYGTAQMKKALAARKGTGCYQTLLSDVAALYMCPEVERLAVAHLHDLAPEVAIDAADTLGVHGSAAAEEPLWTRLREWHQQWAGKAGLLDPTDGNLAPARGGLEYALTLALARSPNWLADPAKLRVLEALCVTGYERGNVHDYLQSWITPLRINYEGDGDTWSIVQYSRLTLFAALEAKLAQFPRGTRFLLSSVNFRDASQQEAIYRRLRPLLERHSLIVTQQGFPTH